MLHNWFLGKVQYGKIMENGMQKKVSEPYLIDALSFTEAEKRLIEEMRPFISGEFTVTAVGRKKYTEVFFNDNGDRFYAVRVAFITLDEKSGSEKRTKVEMLVQASTLPKALEIHTKMMKDTLADYIVTKIEETPIMDVFPWTGEKNDPESKEELIAEKRNW